MGERMVVHVGSGGGITVPEEVTGDIKCMLFSRSFQAVYLLLSQIGLLPPVVDCGISSSSEEGPRPLLAALLDNDTVGGWFDRSPIFDRDCFQNLPLLQHDFV